MNIINGLDPKLQIKLNSINEEVLKKMERTIFENIKKNSIPPWNFQPIRDWKPITDTVDNRDKEFRNYVVWNYPMGYTKNLNSYIDYFNDVDTVKEPNKVFRIGLLIIATIVFVYMWNTL